MVVPLKPVHMLAVMLLVIFTISQCQETESRRAVTEHQLMHDRGRTIQSLKRLIWLSSAMEGLHTAQARSALYPPPMEGLHTAQARSALYPPPMEGLHTAQTRSALYPPSMEGLHTAQTRSALYPPPMEGLHTAQARSALYPPSMEGLHSAQARSALYPPSFGLSQGLVSGLTPFPANQDSVPSRGEMESLLRDFFNPHLSGLSEKEP